MRSKKTLLRTDGFRELSRSELIDLIDTNTRKFLGVGAQEFLRRREQHRPLKNPAWGPIDMLASLLPK